VQLAIGTNKRDHNLVRACVFELNHIPIAAHLNVIPLGSYSVLFNMDGLYLHKTKVYCYDKAIKRLDDNEEKRILQGKKNPTSVRMVTTMHAKHSCRKWCVMFIVHISNDKGKDVEDS